MTLLLAHGAGAGQDHPWMRRVVTAFGAHGIHVVTFNFPYMDAGRKAPDRAPVLEAHYARVWQDTAARVPGATVAAETRPATDLTRATTPVGPMIAGGKSMGGRIASQVAAAGGFDPAPAALIFFGYPLHPPNQPGKRRDAHLPKIAAPMLFLHGTRDPFGTPDEMRALVDTLPRATLHLIDGGDHSLVVKRKDATDSVERAVAEAAAWIGRTLGPTR